MVVGPQSYHRLPDLLARSATRRASSTPNFPVEDKFDHLPRRAGTTARGVSAFLTVQEGCDKFCTFCVVPYTRGAEVSRPVAAIAGRGRSASPRPACARSRLIGQNVNAYHGDGPDGATVDARPPDARGWRAIPGIAAPPLHHQPSPRHGRRR